MHRFALLLVLSLATLCPAAGADRRGPDCARVEARISEVRLRLRMGYTARQGRLYRQRLASLEIERRARCR